MINLIKKESSPPEPASGREYSLPGVVPPYNQQYAAEYSQDPTIETFKTEIEEKKEKLRGACKAVLEITDAFKKGLSTQEKLINEKRKDDLTSLFDYEKTVNKSLLAWLKEQLKIMNWLETADSGLIILFRNEIDSLKEIVKKLEVLMKDDKISDKEVNGRKLSEGIQVMISNLSRWIDLFEELYTIVIKGKEERKSIATAKLSEGYGEYIYDPYNYGRSSGSEGSIKAEQIWQELLNKNEDINSFILDLILNIREIKRLHDISSDISRLLQEQLITGEGPYGGKGQLSPLEDRKRIGPPLLVIKEVIYAENVLEIPPDKKMAVPENVDITFKGETNNKEEIQVKWLAYKDKAPIKKSDKKNVSYGEEFNWEAGKFERGIYKVWVIGKNKRNERKPYDVIELEVKPSIILPPIVKEKEAVREAKRTVRIPESKGLYTMEDVRNFLANFKRVRNLLLCKNEKGEELIGSYINAEEGRTDFNSIKKKIEGLINRLEEMIETINNSDLSRLDAESKAKLEGFERFMKDAITKLNEALGKKKYKTVPDSVHKAYSKLENIDLLSFAILLLKIIGVYDMIVTELERVRNLLKIKEDGNVPKGKRGGWKIGSFISESDSKDDIRIKLDDMIKRIKIIKELIGRLDRRGLNDKEKPGLAEFEMRLERAASKLEDAKRKKPKNVKGTIDEAYNKLTHIDIEELIAILLKIVGVEVKKKEEVKAVQQAVKKIKKKLGVRQVDKKPAAPVEKETFEISINGFTINGGRVEPILGEGNPLVLPANVNLKANANISNKRAINVRWSLSQNKELVKRSDVITVGPNRDSSWDMGALERGVYEVMLVCNEPRVYDKVEIIAGELPKRKEMSKEEIEIETADGVDGFLTQYRDIIGKTMIKFGGKGRVLQAQHISPLDSEGERKEKTSELIRNLNKLVRKIKEANNSGLDRKDLEVLGGFVRITEKAIRLLEESKRKRKTMAGSVNKAHLALKTVNLNRLRMVLMKRVLLAKFK
ncbi:MAG: hypothetical protein KKC75_01660 [Nanoarchaeota archaeon]|nr:hypothetical protein [Nanoarchaeota archaeon]MBU1946213.1 hypothetical protein [Nanoarchaeota archaeon]